MYLKWIYPIIVFNVFLEFVHFSCKGAKKQDKLFVENCKSLIEIHAISCHSFVDVFCFLDCFVSFLVFKV